MYDVEYKQSKAVKYLALCQSIDRMTIPQLLQNEFHQGKETDILTYLADDLIEIEFTLRSKNGDNYTIIACST